MSLFKECHHLPSRLAIVEEEDRQHEGRRGRGTLARRLRAWCALGLQGKAGISATRTSSESLYFSRVQAEYTDLDRGYPELYLSHIIGVHQEKVLTVIGNKG